MRFSLILCVSASIWISTSSVSITQFFPYGPTVGDAKLPANDDGSSPKVTISTLFPLFNFQHHSLFVNTNGAISFLETLSTYTPAAFPLSNGRRIIAPFWADVDIRNGGNVYYRETTNMTLLDRATSEVKRYFPSQMKFQANWVFIATWDNVAFFGADSLGKTKRNTFQAVLITNGRHSFTIFLYHQVQWTTGTASSGDATTGLGGTPAQVGFNAGDGINYFAVNASRTRQIINVPTMSNVATPGKFVFRIDTAEIENGGCNTEGSLTITPRHGTMLGGQRLIISGPCLTEIDNITAMYHIVQKEYPCARRSEFSMTCVTPMFYNTGDINIVIRVQHGDGTFSNFTGVFSILNIANTKPTLMRDNPKAWRFGQTVRLRWTKENVPFGAQFVKLDIFFIQLKEKVYDLEWFHGGTVFPNLTVDAETVSFVLNVRKYVAVLRLSPANGTDIWHTESVWSDVFPVIPRSNTVSRRLCSEWYTSDVTLQALSNTDSQPCPCTLRQALLDTGRFHRDPLCNSFRRQNDEDFALNCVNHGNAHHCIRLNVVGAKGVGRLCCYDKAGTLMDARNMKGGGTVHRHHYIGSDGNVPFLSNFFLDLVPYLQCCVYRTTDNSGGPVVTLSLTRRTKREIISGDTCTKFFERRPPSDCRGYQPPRPARTNGDPHMKTLDGLSYTFNGKGEYVLLRDVQNRFVVQVRMEQVVDQNGIRKEASVLTSIVARTNNISDTIEARINPIRVADVLQNGDILDFTDSTWLDFKGGSLLLLQDDQDHVNDSKEILIRFNDPQVSFQVKATHQLINIVTIVADKQLQGNIEGLLGDYDGDETNDLKTSNGTIIPPNSPMYQIHYNFGETWRILPDESMFTYPIGKTYSDYADPQFRPNFNAPIINVDLSGAASGVCGRNFDCLFDLQTTGSEEIAMLTKEASERFEEMEVDAQPVVSCNLPQVVMFGQWNTTGYISGSMAYLICNQGYMPSLSGEIVCGNDGEWDNKDVKCVKSKASGTFMQSGNVVFYVLLTMFLLLLWM